MGALTFLEPNKNSEWLHSCLQTRSEAILFSESGMEWLHSLIFLNQTPPKATIMMNYCVHINKDNYKIMEG
jgi:hypothetical protein